MILKPTITIKPKIRAAYQMINYTDFILNFKSKQEIFVKAKIKKVKKVKNAWAQ